MRAIPSWQTRFAMPVRCALLAQHPSTRSRFHFVEWSSALHFAEEAVDEVHRPLLCRVFARMRIISTRPAAPYITLHRADSRHRHKASIDDAVLARLRTD